MQVQNNNIIMEEVLEDMSIEPEVEKVLVEHKQILNEHTDKIQQLELDQVAVKSDLTNIKSQMTDVKEAIIRFESNSYQTFNSILQSTTQLVTIASNNNVEIIKSKDVKDTEIVKTKDNNKKDIIIKVLAIFGACLAGWLASKYGIKISM